MVTTIKESHGHLQKPICTVRRQEGQPRKVPGWAAPKLRLHGRRSSEGQEGKEEKRSIWAEDLPAAEFVSLCHDLGRGRVAVGRTEL